MDGREEKMCWREKKETRLWKSENSVRKVLSPRNKMQKKRYGFKIPLPNKEMKADATSDRKGPKAHFMSSKGNLLLQSKYHTYAARVCACACQTE